MRVPTAVGLRRLSQPARRAPSCIGLTSRGGIGMRVPTAAGLRRLSQPTRCRAPSCIGLTSRGGIGMRVPHRSWTSSSFSASPKAPSCIGLTSRGGLRALAPLGDSTRFHQFFPFSIDFKASVEPARSKDTSTPSSASSKTTPTLLFATSSATLRHPPQQALGPSLRPGFPREEAPPGGLPSSYTPPPTAASPVVLAMVGLSSRGGTARWGPHQLYFATYISQPRGSRYGRAFLARRHRQVGPLSSCTSPPTPASPGALAMVGLSSRGGTARWDPSSCTSPLTPASPVALAMVGLSFPISFRAHLPSSRCFARVTGSLA